MSPVPVPGGMGDVKEGFEPMPAGTYLAEVSDAEETQATGDGKAPAGTPIIKLEFTIQEEEYEGRRAWVNLTFTEKAMGVVKGTLKGLGYTEEELADPDLEINAEDLVGRQAKVVLKIGTNPKTQEKNNSVRRVLPLNEQESELPG